MLKTEIGWVHTKKRGGLSCEKFQKKKNIQRKMTQGRPRRRWWSQVNAVMERIVATEEDDKIRFIWRSHVFAAKYQLKYRIPWE